MGTDWWLPSRKVSFCDRGGMPVTGSSFAFSWPIVHDGVTRRSEDEFSEVIWRGRSPAVCMLIFVGSQSEFEFDVEDVRERVGCRSSGGFGFGGMRQFQVSPGPGGLEILLQQDARVRRCTSLKRLKGTDGNIGYWFVEQRG
jgi:hypothetical protein